MRFGPGETCGFGPRENDRYLASRQSAPQLLLLTQRRSPSGLAPRTCRRTLLTEPPVKPPKSAWGLGSAVSRLLGTGSILEAHIVLPSEKPGFTRSTSHAIRRDWVNFPLRR